MSHGAIKLVVYIGIGGVFGVLIGVLLMTAGVALWADPTHRTFYGVAGVVLGILSFPASNLGGFFLCMLLAVVGGSLAFAWTPVAVSAEPTRPAAGTTDQGHGTTMLALGAPLLVAAGLLAALPAAHAHAAAPQKSSRTCILAIICVGGGSSSPPSPSPSSPSPTCLPTALPTALPTSLPTSLPTGLPKCVASALPTALPTTLPTALPTALPGGAPVPSVPGVSSLTPRPGRSGGKSADPKAKTSTARPGLVVPAATSVITAGSATLVHFLYQGNVKLPTASGATVTMMKFTADSLTLSGGAADTITEAGTTAVTSSPVMAFSGNVVLYATKLSGTLGPVPLTFTPTTVSAVLLKVANLITGTQVTLTNVTTDQALGTADSLTYGPGGEGFSVVLH